MHLVLTCRLLGPGDKLHVCPGKRGRVRPQCFKIGHFCLYIKVKVGTPLNQGRVTLVLWKENEKEKKAEAFVGASPYLKLVSLWETLVSFLVGR